MRELQYLQSGVLVQATGHVQDTSSLGLCMNITLLKVFAACAWPEGCW